MKPAQLAYEEKRAAKAGITLEQSLRNRRPADQFAELVGDFIRACDEFDKAMDASQGAGYIQATPKLRSLLTEKVRLLAQIKRGL
jgi:hypothetical protein